MSRIGHRPIKIEDDVKVEISQSKVNVSLGDSKMCVNIPKQLTVKVIDGFVEIDRLNDTKYSRSQHGLISRLIKNAISGVKSGFTKELTYSGTGYRVNINSDQLVLHMGYSHQINLIIPKNIKIETKKNRLLISGYDKEAVGQFAAKIRQIRSPEVYKGKGIKYADEFIKRKAGKKASS